MLQTMPRRKQLKDNQNDLRAALLTYFLEPHLTIGIHNLPLFKPWKHTDVRYMLRALVRAGLIKDVAGKGGRATTYQTTKAGRAMLPDDE